MKKLKIYFFLFLTLIYSSSFSQNKYVDSLKQILTRPNLSSSEKIPVLEQLVERYRTEQQYSIAKTYANSLLSISQQEKNQTEIVKAYTFLGIIANNEEKYKEVVNYIDLAKNALSKDDNSLAKAYCFYLQAYQEQSLDQPKKAMSFALQSIKAIENAGKDDNLSFKLNYILYGIYSNWNDEKNSLKYAELTLKFAQNSKNKNNISNAYSALASAYAVIYNKTKNKEDLTKIIENAQIASDLNKRFPGQVANSTHAIALNNLASYYVMFFPKRTPELKKKIIENIEEALKIAKLSPNTQPAQAGSLGMLANLAVEAGDLNLAENYLLQAENVLLSQKPVYNYLMTTIVTELSKLYKQKGNFPKALEYQEKLTHYNQLLFDETQAAEVNKIEAQYQSEKKEEEVQQQKKQKFWYAGAAFLTLLGAFFMFRSYHFRLKYSLEREKQLSLEKSEADLQINLEKEEQARLKAEQQVLSLQQEKLQNEVMANQLHLQHKNEVLHQLKEKLDDDKTLNIQQILREENLLDKDFEKAKFDIQEIHPNFFKNLNEKSKQKLTDLDLKYCAYMHLGMNTKQIANLLNVEPKSVNMTKYRLKKKFELDMETDLIQFIKGVI